MIINHISIGTKDVVTAVAFYDAVFETLSVKRSHYIDGIAAAYGDSFEFGLVVLVKIVQLMVMDLMSL